MQPSEVVTENDALNDALSALNVMGGDQDAGDSVPCGRRKLGEANWGLRMRMGAGTMLK
jgi:hypothetical protein